MTLREQLQAALLVVLFAVAKLRQIYGVSGDFKGIA